MATPPTQSPLQPASQDAPPAPPEAPDAFACCGSDCGEACVWSIYQYEQKLHAAALEAWRQRQRAGDADTAPMRGE